MLKYLKTHIKNYMNKSIIDIYKTKYSKRVLISYITKPFRNSHNKHSNHIEVTTMAEVFNGLGYSVDVVEYNKKIPKKVLDKYEYDIIIGFGEAFIQTLFCKKYNKALKISYETGSSDCFQNRAELHRLKELEKRKNILLRPKRFINQAWSVYAHLSNAIILIGNENFTKKTFSEYTDTKCYPINLPIYQYFNTYNFIRDYKKASKNILWFGSGGLVHKGLDLCLDYFVNQNDYILHVCGPKEKDFFDLYQNELNHKNVIYHGFVDISGNNFKNIVSSCAFVIFPTCSEGMSGSLLTAMSTGLLPIATRESGIDYIDKYGYIINGSKDSIDDIMKKIKSLSYETMLDKSKSLRNYVKENFTKKQFSVDFKKIIEEIIEKGK